VKAVAVSRAEILLDALADAAGDTTPSIEKISPTLIIVDPTVRRRSAGRNPRREGITSILVCNPRAHIGYNARAPIGISLSSGSARVRPPASAPPSGYETETGHDRRETSSALSDHSRYSLAKYVVSSTLVRPVWNNSIGPLRVWLCNGERSA
jgi:hypothetical protein